MTLGIAVMAKAPRPGQAKTRLCPAVTPDTAALLGAAFLKDVLLNLRKAAALRPITVYVAYAPAGTEALLQPLLPPGVALLLADGAIDAPQGVTGFGRCLLHATEAMFARGHTAAVVLNADSPTLPTRLLLRLHDLLDQPGDRAVLGPAEDGGYYALGMKAPHAPLLADIAWSTDRVAEQTRGQAAKLGLECLELDMWYDVDEPATLSRLARELADDGGEIFEAPNTRGLLQACGLLQDRAPTGAAA